MEDRQERLIRVIMESDPLNSQCAECARPGPDWVSTSLAIFLCIECVGVHRSLDPKISKGHKSINLDTWTPSDFEAMRNGGNSKAHAQYEEKIPKAFHRTSFRTPRNLRKHIFQKKYSAQYDEQTTTPCFREGWLWKKGKARKLWQQRWFILRGDEISYYITQADVPHNPKETMKLTDVMVSLRSDEDYKANFKNKYGFQLTFFKPDPPKPARSSSKSNPSTPPTTPPPSPSLMSAHDDESSVSHIRNYFICADDGDTLLDWVNAIRVNKSIEHGFDNCIPADQQKKIVQGLRWEVTHEGYLHKTGGSSSVFRRRWFSLMNNRLVYFKQPLDGVALGVIKLDEQCVLHVVPYEVHQAHCFELRLPNRTFLIKADTQQSAEDWMKKLKQVLPV
eukprot:m.64000 g.64000  ORF g.64000 m.64000 type:complete len:392 (-) comp23380_c0_seq2:452-1627(-)